MNTARSFLTAGGWFAVQREEVRPSEGIAWQCSNQIPSAAPVTPFVGLIHEDCICVYMGKCPGREEGESLDNG